MHGDPTQDRIAFEVLDALRQPLMVLAPCRSIRLANAAAARYLARADVLAERDGKLVCADAASQPDLERALDRVAHGIAAQVAVRLARNGSEARIAASLRRLDRHGGGDVVLSLLDADARHDVCEEMLAAAFRFTPAEARVAAALARGSSAKQVAASQKVAVSTVRSQMKGIFEKTGCHRQADLVRLLLMAEEA